MDAPRYEIEFSRTADKQLQSLPDALQRRIVRAAEKLEANPRPHGSIKLAGADDVYRIRVGDYRVIYEIEDRRLVVLVVQIAHRRDVYRR